MVTFTEEILIGKLHFWGVSQKSAVVLNNHIQEAAVENQSEYWKQYLKVLCATHLLVFVCRKESFSGTRKNVYFTSIALFFLRKSSLDFSDVQMSWRHQMPNHETQNTFYRIIMVPQFGNEIGPVYVILQKKTFYQKILLKMRPGN